MRKKEPVYVRYVELTPLGERALDVMECERRLELPGASVGNFYCREFKLLITISACAICKELMARAAD